MQYTSNILAIVGHGENFQFSSKRLTLWDTKINAGTLEISFPTKIVKVRMNDEVIFVATKERIYLYHLDGLRLLDRLDVDNHLGRIVLSPQPEMNPFMVYSHSLKEGSILVYDTRTALHRQKINCHKTPILQLAISFMGNMIATSSTAGQMIRVFNLQSGDKLYTFSRGLKNATQYSLSFNKSSSLLMSSSDTGTIHLFQLEDPLKADTSKGNLSIVDENKVASIRAKQAAATGNTKWFNFLVPKTCDDFVGAEKSIMFVNQP